MMCGERKWILYVSVLFACLLSTAVAAQVIPTEPEGPTTLTIDATSRRQAADASTIQAVAGNVTQLNIVGNTVTQTWQAYYGNVSGTVTLDDANNNTIYDWALASPEGEVYASEAAVDFTYGNVFCYDFDKTDIGDSGYNTLSEYETLLGLESDDVDGINETFAESTSYKSFYVGSYFVNNASVVCPTTQMYATGEEKDASLFQEVLMYDNSSDKLVYVSIIEQDRIGFDEGMWDFEMIVGENGHDGDTSTTQFYFYVELE